MKFGEKLKNRRLEKKMTQEEVAEKVGISRRAYISYEQDDVRPRNRDTYSKLAVVLGCNINYLLMDDDAALMTGALAATSLFGRAIGTVSFPPVGAIAALTAMAGIMQNSKKEKESDEEPISYKNGNLLQYEKKQKKFQAIAMGIIYSTLTSLGIVYQPEINKNIDELSGTPDEVISLSAGIIKNWWFSFWAKDEDIDAKVTISATNRAAVMISRYVTMPKNKERKISIVVDDIELYKAICKFKNHNSYNGNLSVIFIDQENVKLEKEEFIAISADLNSEKELISFSNSHNENAGE